MPTSDEFRNWATVVTAFIAIAVFAWNIYTYVKNRPFLVVDGKVNPSFEYEANINITNPSRTKITVVALGYKPKSDKDFYVISYAGYVKSKNEYLVTDSHHTLSLPKTLAESEMHAFLAIIGLSHPIDDTEFLIAKDSNGKVYKSKKMPFK